ncbi:type I restriction modification DNA specificity protein [Azomonas agilis]|uniref:Type I restriction modification DNA specificity protein n=1 Tax=Azomonas agilis TaxID=116849 RepID=A0A562HZH7_9GAMM|nr:restriction endonuclease subunit S [Azomonas agilis]TWH64170.1 type I restriction modification DNA specificity protein [Azomonas agilis]
MVPEGWEVKYLSELASKVSDGIHKTPVYADASDIYFINGNNLKNGSIIIQESTKCVDKNDAINHRKKLGDRTILMSINGTIGNLAYYKGENVVLGKSTAYISIGIRSDLDFVYYVLSSSKTQAFYESELTRTTILNLSIKSIKNTRIKTPPPPRTKENRPDSFHLGQGHHHHRATACQQPAAEKSPDATTAHRQKRLLDQNGVRFEGDWKDFPLNKMAEVIVSPVDKKTESNEIPVELCN